ncbi:MAG: HAD family phosphatase [Candidatus Micrarchaeaceae archaeon]
MPNQIKAIIFDIGGVITHFPDSKYFSYLSKLSGKDAQHVRSYIGAMIPTLEKGLMSAEEFENKIAKRLGITPRQVQWYSYYAKFVRVDRGVTSLVSELHKQYITAYITNIDASKYSILGKLISADIFEYKFASCYMHLRKPDKRIYEKALKRMKVQPNQSIFIDNQEENVAGAIQAGMHSILYKNRRLLDIELNRLLK